MKSNEKIRLKELYRCAKGLRLPVDNVSSSDDPDEV